MHFKMLLLSAYVIVFSFQTVHCKKKDTAKPDWTKKDILDYTDVDVERLYDQWEEDEEPLEPDELPEHLRQPAQIDMSKLDPSNPEELLSMTKKGKSLMAFVTVSGTPTEVETREITALWQHSLINNHIEVEKYPIGTNRVIFMFKDGSRAFEAKDFLIKQERLEVMTIENREYFGEHSSKAKAFPKDDSTENSKMEKKQSKKKKKATDEL